MKLTLTRATALLALALGLSGCGGKATFTLSGPITGLAYGGLVITNTTNGDTASPKAGDTTFTLGQTLEYGQVYDVQITTQPANQTCALSGGADTAGRLSTLSIPVVCVVQTFTIGGTVSGLRSVADATTPTGLVVTNGTDQLAINLDGAYTMPTSVAYDQTYGVTIVTQPTGKICTIDNPSGTVKTVTNSLGTTGVVNNINITCAPSP